MNTKENILLVIVALIVLWFAFSRLRFIVFTQMSWWTLGLLMLIAIVVLFLVLDHFFDRSR
ncbi:MAG: hypothetical protein LUQ22_05770 [Methanotrichaceae archaeon]|nr:hypothetical protein [Methanotrichaceae archaeon]